MSRKIDDGLTPQQRYRIKNPDYYKRYNEKWRAEHPEYESQWKALNPDKRAEYAANYKLNADPEDVKAIRKRHYEKHKDVYQDYGRRHGKQFPEKRMFNAARVTARKQNLPFNIKLEDIVIPEVCPVFGIPLEVTAGPRTNNTPSLDKIIPELGYVKGNIRVISFRANRLKSDASLEEIQKLLLYMSR